MAPLRASSWRERDRLAMDVFHTVKRGIGTTAGWFMSCGPE
jgi:hypothetical protein